MEKNKTKKINIKIENDNKGLPNELEIQDSSLDVDSSEERPGVGYEIFVIPTNH